MNEWLKSSFEQAENKYVAYEKESEDWSEIIYQLRSMDTATPRALADEMEIKLKATLNTLWELQSLATKDPATKFCFKRCINWLYLSGQHV